MRRRWYYDCTISSSSILYTTKATIVHSRFVTHFPCETEFVVVATTAYRAMETETAVR